MRKILIGLLAVFAACNISEFPKNLIKSNAKTYIKKVDYFSIYDEFNGYDKKECILGRCEAIFKNKDKDYFDNYYRILIYDWKILPCITKYAYSVGNWDGESRKNPNFSDDNVAISIYKNTDFHRFWHALYSYYRYDKEIYKRGKKVVIMLNEFEDHCIFFKKYPIMKSAEISDPHCMILKRKYVTLLTKLEAEKYLKDHPETVNLREDTFPTMY